MRCLSAVVLLASIAMTGCVTETRINGKLTSNNKGEVDKTVAARTRLNLAIRYIDMGNSEAAKRNLDLAEKLAPDMVDVYITQAHFYQSVAQPQKAVAAFDKALDLEPDNADVMNNFGVMRCSLGEYQQAEQLFSKALSDVSYVKVADTNENAGLCAYRAGEYDKAEAYLKAALDYNQRRPRALLGLAEINLEHKNYKAARSYLLQYQRLSKNTPKSLLAWIRLENGAGDFAAEAQRGKELKTLFPDAPQTKRYLTNDY
jgi:type IV pilus assembly protein PilF